MLVDRPGRGYGDDYSPWLVEAPVGRARARARARRSRRRGSSPRRLTACSASSPARATTSRQADGFVAIHDINPQAETHLLVLPERHVDTFRDVGEFPADEAKRMLEFVAETRATARPRGLPRAS